MVSVLIQDAPVPGTAGIKRQMAGIEQRTKNPKPGADILKGLTVEVQPTSPQVTDKIKGTIIDSFRNKCSAPLFRVKLRDQIILVSVFDVKFMGNNYER